MRSTAFRRRWRSSSGCRAAAARARSRRPPRSGTSCACSTSSSACSTAPRTARRCGRRAPRASPRRSCATTRASTSACSRRWWWRRKGVYTDLAKWAKARGHTHLRVDGDFIKVDPWPRLDRFKEHTLELPVGDLVVERRERGRAARPADEGARHRQGRDAPAEPARRPARRHARRHADAPGRRGQGVLDQARLPDLRHQLPRARPAHVQLQQQARLVHRLRRHRPGADARAAQGLRRLGARRRRQGPRAELPGRGGRGRGPRRRAVRGLRRHAPEPGVARRHLRRPFDRRHRAVVGHRRAPLGRGARTLASAATPRSRATSSPRSGAGSSSSRRSASAT